MNYEEFVEVMKNLSFLFVLFAGCLLSTELSAQPCWGGYTPNPGYIDCAPGWTPGSPSGPCCATAKACNSYASPCPTYDPVAGVGGCDMSCTPIDSGVLFLLLGGAAFGGFLIMRRRETDLIPTRS